MQNPGTDALESIHHHRVRLAGTMDSRCRTACGWLKPVSLQNLAMMFCTSWSSPASLTHSRITEWARSQKANLSNLTRLPDLGSPLFLLSPNADHGWHEKPPDTKAGDWQALCKVATMAGSPTSPTTTLFWPCRIWNKPISFCKSLTASMEIPEALIPSPMNPAPAQTSTRWSRYLL